MLQTQQELLQATFALRNQILKTINNRDLNLALPGNPTLRKLILEFFCVEAAYIRSFKEFSLRFDIAAPTGKHSVESLTARFKKLDAELLKTLEALSDEDLDREVERGQWSLPVEANFHVFREAILIFAAKAVVYLRALNKPITGQLAEWIG
jgi:hypothetical protein